MDFSWWCKDTVSSAVAPCCGIWEGRNSIYMGSLCLYTFLSRIEEDLLMKVFPQSSLVSPQRQQSERVQQLTHVAWLLSHKFRTFLHFQLAKQVTHILPCCAPTSAPTLNYRTWHLSHWIGLVRVRPTAPASYSLTVSSQLCPTQPHQASIKGNLLHSPQKSRKWLSEGKS